MTDQRTISFPFRFEYGSVAATTDYQKIWQDRVQSAVGTAIGERPMDRVDYGTILAKSLWANQDDAAQIAREQIPLAFTKHLPYLALDGVEVYEVYEEVTDNTYLQVDIDYILPNGDDIKSEAIIGSLDAAGEVNVYETYTVPAYLTQTSTDEEEQ